MINVCLILIIILSFIGSIFGLQLYSTIEFKSREDDKKDIFIFSWFIISLVITFVSFVISMVIKSQRTICLSFIVGVSCISIITGGCGWDLSSRIKNIRYESEDNFLITEFIEQIIKDNEASFSRKLYTILTGISILFLIIGAYLLENN